MAVTSSPQGSGENGGREFVGVVVGRERTRMDEEREGERETEKY